MLHCGKRNSLKTWHYISWQMAGPRKEVSGQCGLGFGLGAVRHNCGWKSQRQSSHTGSTGVDRRIQNLKRRAITWPTFPSTDVSLASSWAHQRIGRWLFGSFAQRFRASTCTRKGKWRLSEQGEESATVGHVWRRSYVQSQS